jgi:hypothetical protein
MCNLTKLRILFQKPLHNYDFNDFVSSYTLVNFDESRFNYYNNPEVDDQVEVSSYDKA